MSQMAELDSSIASGEVFAEWIEARMCILDRHGTSNCRRIEHDRVISLVRIRI